MSIMKRLLAFILLGAMLAMAAYVLRRDGGDPASDGPGAAISPQEQAFRECVAARDREIHRRTFATIDNPDVQREILATEKERAVRECRELYPDL